MTSPGASIRVLPVLVANQIAAGEVVERPASIVKELVENALDAGATRIALDLEEGGIELVRVGDDGGGIEPAELALALAPHATSKIRTSEDLARVGTFGFRGEALASIASVSRVTIRSRTARGEGASEIECEGDVVSAVRPAPGSRGTIVSVRNVFFNTPARRKFLRTPQTEQTRCLDTLRDLALAHAGVAFTATCNGRVVMDLPPGQSPRERVLAILGNELKDQLLEVNHEAMSDARGLTLWGMVGTPSVARATNKAQHVFVNGRSVRDRTIQHALGEAFRGLIEPGRHPMGVLMIELSPEGVDVNVHPAKTEVRFRDSSMVHSLVLRSVREALQRADLTPSVFQVRPQLGGVDRALPGAFAHPPVDVRAGVERFVEYFRRPQANTATGQERLSFGAVKEALQGEGVGGLPEAAPHAMPHESPEVLIPAPAPQSQVLQVHKSYLVTQDEQGVVIIDQHALHERVMFEYLLTRVSEGGLEGQRLLTPVVVEVSSLQMERLEGLTPLLERIGITAEAMGRGAIGVHVFPTFLFDRGVEAGEFLTDLLDKAGDEAFMTDARRGGENAMRDVLDMMACKAAVKAGDGLSGVELGELVRLRAEVERSSNCPHGRPTSVRLTIRELEKLFGRT